MKTIPVDVGSYSPRVCLIDMLIRHGMGSDDSVGISLADKISVRAGLGNITQSDLDIYRALCPVYGSGFSIKKLTPGVDRKEVDPRAYKLFESKRFHPLFNGGSLVYPFSSFNVSTPLQAEMHSDIDMQGLAAALDGPSNVYTIVIDGVWFGPAQNVAVKRFGLDVAGLFPKVNVATPPLGLGSKLFGFDAFRFEEE